MTWHTECSHTQGRESCQRVVIHKLQRFQTVFGINVSALGASRQQFPWHSSCKEAVHHREQY